MSSVEVTIVKHVTAKVLARAIDMVEKHKKQLYMDAEKLAKMMIDLLKDYTEKENAELGKAGYLRLSLVVFSAIRMMMYVLAEAFYKRLDERTPAMPGKKLAYAKTINEVLEIAWHLSQEILMCPECGEEDKPLYM